MTGHRKTLEGDQPTSFRSIPSVDPVSSGTTITEEGFQAELSGSKVDGSTSHDCTLHISELHKNMHPVKEIKVVIKVAWYGKRKEETRVPQY